MDKILIYGPSRLHGTVSISGAKNAALPILAATLLSSGWNELNNVPDLKDIDTIIVLLKHLGVQIEKKGRQVMVNANRVERYDAPYELVKTMRASILVLGPLLARFSQARVSLPGGCAIGERPINFHLQALKKLGADIHIEQGYVCATAKQLVGAHISFEMPTVTGTENIMMAASLAKGTTIMDGAAREPEIEDLAALLNKMGAKITGAGTSRITIEGVSELKATSYSVMPDRIEAGTFLIAAAAAGGQIEIENCHPAHLNTAIEKLKSAGVKISTTENAIIVSADGSFHSLHIETAPYPGFPTDLQAQMMVFLSQISGESQLVENIFENRFNHVAELRRMGAYIQVKGKTAWIKGRASLSGAPVMATDLRASASLIIAGLVARGKTEISRVYHLDRGYEYLDEKLLKLGVRIERLRTKER